MLVFCLLLIFTSAVVSVCLVQYISEEMLFLPPMSRPESPLFQNSENQERGGGFAFSISGGAPAFFQPVLHLQTRTIGHTDAASINADFIRNGLEGKITSRPFGYTPPFIK